VIDQTRSELLKIRTTRTTLGLLIALIVLATTVTVLSGLLSKVNGLEAESDQRDLLATGGFASVFALLAGILVVTSEFRFGTVRPTFLVTPVRSRVIEAKLLASMLTGVALAVVAELIVLAIGYAILAGRGIPIALDGGDTAVLALRVLADAALWGGIGVGAAAMIRNQVASVIVVLAWLFVVEALLVGFFPSAGRFAPGQASQALNGSSDKDLLPPLAGGALLAAWVAALVAGGIAVTAARDVD
jgi:ABC-2 type transport system permease protein